MGTSTLLCIHRDPAQLSLLQEHGYELATATNGSDGLRLFMSRPVDAVVLEYHLGLLDGAAVADEIKHVRPEVPVVMLADHLDLPDGALKSVDAIVAKSDGVHFLLATVHFVMNIKPVQRREARLRAQTPANIPRPARSRAGADPMNPNASLPIDSATDAPFSPEVWRNIRNGTIEF
jgi:response regulator RpfG family c-di-GMP phosphodiesterase